MRTKKKFAVNFPVTLNDLDAYKYMYLEEDAVETWLNGTVYRPGFLAGFRFLPRFFTKGNTNTRNRATTNRSRGN